MNLIGNFLDISSILILVLLGIFVVIEYFFPDETLYDRLMLPFDSPYRIQYNYFSKTNNNILDVYPNLIDDAFYDISYIIVFDPKLVDYKDSLKRIIHQIGYKNKGKSWELIIVDNVNLDISDFLLTNSIKVIQMVEQSTCYQNLFLGSMFSQGSLIESFYIKNDESINFLFQEFSISFENENLLFLRLSRTEALSVFPNLHIINEYFYIEVEKIAKIMGFSFLFKKKKQIIDMMYSAIFNTQFVFRPKTMDKKQFYSFV